jgi:hypothetical protein
MGRLRSPLAVAEVMVQSSWTEQLALLGCGVIVLITAKVLLICTILIIMEVLS